MASFCDLVTSAKENDLLAFVSQLEAIAMCEVVNTRLTFRLNGCRLTLCHRGSWAQPAGYHAHLIRVRSS